MAKKRIVWFENKTQNTMFIKRTKGIYFTQRKRAGNKPFPLTLTMLRERCHRALGQVPGFTAGCYYCLAPLTIATLSLDHVTPVSRNGSHQLSNLVITCAGCNKAKGLMNDEEFRRLLCTLKFFHPVAKNDLLMRLKIGAKVYMKKGKHHAFQSNAAHRPAA
jgi:hypothetical protein